MSEKIDGKHLRVLRAVCTGADTASDIANDLGITVTDASGRLSRLAEGGFLESAGEFKHHNGRRSFTRWRPTDRGKRFG